MNRFRSVAAIIATIFSVAAVPFVFPASQVGSVSPAAPMLEPRSGHSATLLPDGKVLIVGGMRHNQDFYRSAELYDPATGKFTTISKMTTKRGGPSATFWHLSYCNKRRCL